MTRKLLVISLVLSVLQAYAGDATATNRLQVDPNMDSPKDKENFFSPRSADLHFRIQWNVCAACRAQLKNIKDKEFRKAYEQKLTPTKPQHNLPKKEEQKSEEVH